MAAFPIAKSLMVTVGATVKLMTPSTPLANRCRSTAVIARRTGCASLATTNRARTQRIVSDPARCKTVSQMRVNRQEPEKPDLEPAPGRDVRLFETSLNSPIAGFQPGDA